MKLLPLILAAAWIPLSAQAPQQQVWTILPLGDSITAGGETFRCYREPLARRLAEANLRVRFVGSQHTPGEPEEMRHEGYGGKTVEFLAENIERLYRANSADIVLLHAGHNHFVEEHPVPGILKATEAIIRAARDINPHVIILLAQVIPAGKLPKYSYLAQLNEELARLAFRMNVPGQPVILVDQASNFDFRTDTISDLVHPNAAGADKMAGKWFDALQPVLSGAPPGRNP